MNLEDNLGDIIRKGRMAAGATPEAAARAAGLTEKELSDLEQSGQVVKKPNYAELGRVIGLNGSSLERIAGGWAPQEQDLSKWEQLRRFTTSGNDMTVNCYLIWDAVSREAALFDTGWNVDAVLATIEENKIQLKHFFITHTHEDHIAGMDVIREKFPLAKLHTNAKSAPPQHKNRANDFIHLGNLRITNRDTPGHAEDGVTYIVGNWPEDAPHVAIVGDAIFSASMGRGNQSWEVARQKVREQILSLPADTLICPGHGPFTTVGEEKKNNPFFS